MDSIYEKYANVLVNYSLDLQKGDKFIIASTYLAEPLIKGVYKAALEVGAFPETVIGINGLARLKFDYGSDEFLKYVSPLRQYSVENYDAFLI